MIDLSQVRIIGEKALKQVFVFADALHLQINMRHDGQITSFRTHRAKISTESLDLNGHTLSLARHTQINDEEIANAIKILHRLAEELKLILGV